MQLLDESFAVAGNLSRRGELDLFGKKEQATKEAAKKKKHE